MKFQLAICLVLLAATSLANAYEGDGQPACRSQEELDVAIYRDSWDPTAFWKCESLNEPASKLRCPAEMGFLDSVKECVPWEEWSWEKPKAPPSELDDE
ncbi:uncharacterized protein LOC6563637 [Drosophila grimshawi]|uniref:GH18866 n=1 Tax=Drosophila grimshawi TaxID=7222 RepID=B4JGF0_DROGR|nr:uncharacterized protein LOC6563637 [Drosophila grimshawi]EDV92619.1 GH18866 [Drosophila grimshawi]